MPHPLDLNYELLKADLSLVDRGSDEYKIIEKYLRSTEPGYTKLQIIDVWKVDRHGVVRDASVCHKHMYYLVWKYSNLSLLMKNFIILAKLILKISLIGIGTHLLI